MLLELAVMGWCHTLFSYIVFFCGNVKRIDALLRSEADHTKTVLCEFFSYELLLFRLIRKVIVLRDPAPQLDVAESDLRHAAQEKIQTVMTVQQVHSSKLFKVQHIDHLIIFSKNVYMDSK